MAGLTDVPDALASCLELRSTQGYRSVKLGQYIDRAKF